MVRGGGWERDGDGSNLDDVYARAEPVTKKQKARSTKPETDKPREGQAKRRDDDTMD